jgi:hypothetical protein
MAAKKKITTKRSSGAAKPRSEAAKKRAAEKRAFRMALKRYNISEATNPRRYNVYISPSHPKSPVIRPYNQAAITASYRRGMGLKPGKPRPRKSPAAKRRPANAFALKISDAHKNEEKYFYHNDKKYVRQKTGKLVHFKAVPTGAAKSQPVGMPKRAAVSKRAASRQPSGNIMAKSQSVGMPNWDWDWPAPAPTSAQLPKRAASSKRAASRQPSGNIMAKSQPVGMPNWDWKATAPAPAVRRSTRNKGKGQMTARQKAAAKAAATRKAKAKFAATLKKNGYATRHKQGNFYLSPSNQYREYNRANVAASFRRHEKSPVQWRSPRKARKVSLWSTKLADAQRFKRKQFTYNGKTYHRVVLSKSSTGKDRLVKYTAGSPSSAKGAKRKRGSTGSSKGQPAKRARAAPATKKRKGGPTVGGSTRMSTRSQKTRGGGSMRRWGDGSGFGGRNMTAQDCRFLKADMEENNESCNADGGPPSVFCDLYIKYEQEYNLHCR